MEHGRSQRGRRGQASPARAIILAADGWDQVWLDGRERCVGYMMVLQQPLLPSRIQSQLD